MKAKRRKKKPAKHFMLTVNNRMPVKFTRRKAFNVVNLLALDINPLKIVNAS
jgi:hypothetical protein